MPNPGWLRPKHVAACPLEAVARRCGVPAALPEAAAATLVSGVTLDSRAVVPGDLYAALPGARAHGAAFVGQAAAAGAVAVLTDATGRDLVAAADDDGARRLPVVVVEDPRAVLGSVSALVYGDLFAAPPGDRPLQLLGVTGTNGKTTTTYLLDGALRGRGATTGLVGTVETRVGDERVPSVRTTPEAPDVHALLATMAERGVTTCSMEVSSHALALHRVDGVVFDVAGFTNLSRDHLDFHRDMEDYFAAKALLLTPAHSRRGVVCVDDDWGRRMAAEASVPVVTVATLSGRDADWTVADRRPDGTRTAFTLLGPGGRRVAATCPLPGAFNVANTALALVVLVEAGWDAQDAADALAGAGAVPGRMEAVAATGAPGEPLGLVDYAHTPEAVHAACDALEHAGRPLVVVLGAGGDRDRAKRPAMGAAAARGADVVIVTDDNPRSEDPASIRAAVLAGARAEVDGGAARAREVTEVPGRRAAVVRAVDAAWGGGTVLLAGKGHEQGQDVAGTVTPFDDRAVLAEALAGAARRRAALPPPPATHQPDRPAENVRAQHDEETTA